MSTDKRLRPGVRIKLTSPFEQLRKGNETSAQLIVRNGATGVVVGAGGGPSVVVQFDDLGSTVGVAVSIKWLTREDDVS